MNQSQQPKGLKVLIILILAIGIFFRFVNLDQKVYWYDETITSLRLGGYTKEEFSQKIAQAGILKVRELQQYQNLNPSRGIIDTINALALGNPEHPPLYFTTAKLWVQGLGNSVAAVRSLSAVMSVLVLFCIYQICVELFGNTRVGWMAVSLMAVSPFQVLYAQEARGYSFLTVIILLSSLAFLQGFRLNTKMRWGIYAATVAMGLYSQLLFGLVAASHGVYAFLIEGLHWSPKFISPKIKAYLISTFLGVLAFLPWIVSLVLHFDGIGWVAKKITFFTLLTRWLINLSSNFLDVQIGFKDQLFDISSNTDPVKFDLSNPWLYLILALVALVGYAVYFTCKYTPKSVSLFILAFMGITTLTLVIPDIISGGQRSSIARYLIPCYLGVQICMAYLLTTQIVSQKRGYRFLTVFILSAGILSCSISAYADTWWNKYSSYYNPQVAAMINPTPQPLVISSNAIRLASLSYQLKPEIQVMFVEKRHLPIIPEGFSDIFLFRPSDILISQLETSQKYKVNPIYPTGYLWKIKVQK